MPGIDSYTKLLLHLDGDKTGRHAVTFTGGTQYGKGSGPFNRGYLDLVTASSQKATIATSTDFDLDDDGFCIEARIKIPSLTETAIVFSRYEASGTLIQFGYLNGSGLFVSLGESATYYEVIEGSTSGWDTTSWHHVALQSYDDAGTRRLRIYHDGTLIGEDTKAGAFNAITGAVEVGVYNGSYYGLAIADLRVTKGALPYDVDGFTPSGHPLEVEPDTVFLLPCEGDASESGHAFEYVGALAATLSGKFAQVIDFPTLKYLKIADHADFDLDGVAFTVELFGNFDSLASSMIIGQWGDSGSNGSWLVDLYDGTQISFFWSEDGASQEYKRFTHGMSTGTYYHIAITYDGTYLRCFIDGVLKGEENVGTIVMYDSSRALNIGSYKDGTSLTLDGRLDEIRLSKGVARWTSAFTPPTAPYDSGEFGGAARGLAASFVAAQAAARGLARAIYVPYDASARGVALVLNAAQAAARGVAADAFDPRAASARGAGRAYNVRQAAARGASAVLVTLQASGRGRARSAETLDEYLLFRSVDGAAFDYDTPVQTNATGIFVENVPAGHTYRYVVRRRNTFGLISQNDRNARDGRSEVLTIVVDGAGEVEPDRPSAPEAFAIAPAAGGTMAITARYPYLADGDRAADAWLVYVTTDGSDPDPEVDVPVEVAMALADGVARLAYTTGAYADGTPVKALVRTRRSGSPDVDSSNTTPASATADSTAPAAPTPTAFIGDYGAGVTGSDG